MIFVTGGAFQGKADFAKKRLALSDGDFADGESCPFHQIGDKPALNRLHLLVRRMLEAGYSEEEMESAILQGIRSGGCRVVLTDEIGCGIVPMKKEERLWREWAGRLSCRLAKEAEAVVLVQCGLPTVLKGELPGGET